MSLRDTGYSLMPLLQRSDQLDTQCRLMRRWLLLSWKLCLRDRRYIYFQSWSTSLRDKSSVYKDMKRNP